MDEMESIFLFKKAPSNLDYPIKNQEKLRIKKTEKGFVIKRGLKFKATNTYKCAVVCCVQQKNCYSHLSISDDFNSNRVQNVTTTINK